MENNKKSSSNKGEIIIYKTSKGPELEVKLKEETIWLSQKQIGVLFDKGTPAINEHIKNVYKEGELNKNSTIRKFRIVQFEGKRRIEREIDFYNLDMILSIGYRVNSKRATQFRIWATKTLKKHLLSGYTLNEKRLLQQSDKFKELQNTISFLGEKSKAQLLQGQAQEILNLLTGYSRSLELLWRYDHDKLTIPRGGKAVFALNYNHVLDVIKKVKEGVVLRGEAGDLFGREVGGKFENIVKNLYQTFGKKELYKTIEEKAAHVLYLTIKDHPFVDGNKRIASFLFVYFLNKNNYLYRESGEKKINDNALVALALLIAVSDPKEKDVMIKIIINLLK
ncbi:MAG: virulence protein RhuM/Fic/DOC family protein [bacterium]|nr:virulence protein RhuM/Fic/DOC family protein [bacterium]